MSEQDDVRALDELRSELLRAASEHRSLARAWTGTRGRRRFVGWAAAAIGPAVAVAIFAIVVISGVGAKRQAAGATPGSSCTRRLLAELGVLRRPQTVVDRRFHPPANPLSRSQHHASAFPYVLVSHLTRVARTLPNGRLIVFATYAPKARSLGAKLGDVVFVSAAGGRTRHMTVITMESVPFLLNAYQLPPLEVDHVLLSVVPDNVRRVQWTFPREQLPKFPGAGAARVLPGGKVTASVTGNVAAARPIPRAFSEPSLTTWLNAKGRTIRTIHYAIPNLAKTRPSSAASSSSSAGIATPIPSGC